MPHDMPRNNAHDISTSLNDTFGQYRAEYIESDLFTFFTHPNYWHKLQSTRPCILEGGRGTGKTTALRGMSYEGQFKLIGYDTSEWDSLGAYWRIESNVVTAFKGKRISTDEWNLYFSHYVNIQLCLLVLDFLLWREDELDVRPEIDLAQWRLLEESFSLSENVDYKGLHSQLRRSLVKFQNALIQPGKNSSDEIRISTLGEPVSLLLSSLKEDIDFNRNYFTFCIDEYENLLTYQQVIINTLIKHVGDGRSTFKIGVKRYGIKTYATLASDQSLQTPADYSEINISEESRDSGLANFSAFAESVCNKRIEVGFPAGTPKITDLLSAMTEEEEAVELGIRSKVERLREKLVIANATSEAMEFFDSLDLLSAYLVEYWADSKNTGLLDALAGAKADPRAWKIRRGNYAYPMLFTLKKKVVGRVKYYSGWDTFVRMSDGNIRLLLQLIYEALTLSIASGNDLSVSVDAESQSRAAERVGGQQVEALLGYSRQGGKIKQLVLSMGRVFQVMARSPQGHAPEINQFRIRRTELDDEQAEKLDELLREAIMHSALVPFVANKKSSLSAETNAPDYMIHPIMTAFFGYSDRRKRKLTISGETVLEMASERASKAIDQLLGSHNRSTKHDVPEQLSIYSEFLNGND